MKKINIIGGGPAGLYFAILMKEAHPDIEINIFERNSEEIVVGWGVVLNLGTLNLLKKCDQDSYEGIMAKAKHWSDVDIIHKDEKISIRGSEYISISRMMLLSALRKRCASLNIPIQYDHPVKQIEEYRDCDLLVGADGANSVVRKHFEHQFKPTVDIRKDKYIWLGSSQVFNTITHIFKQTEHGVFAAEAYLYCDTHSTFIVSCEESCWISAGLDKMSDEQTITFLNKLFESELEQGEITGGKSIKWNNFPIVKNDHWHYSNVVLLGDALHTAHFTIGSGTRLALEDAMSVFKNIEQQDSLESALQEFQISRRPFMERYQDVAFESLKWYENVSQKIHLDLIPFAFEVMTRSKKLGIRSVKLQDPEFAQLYLESIADNVE